MSEFKDWWYSVPIFTRYWLTITVAASIIGRFGLINPYYCVLDWYLIFGQFQIWRPITALFFYPITPGTGFHFLINCYFLYSYSQRLELTTFAGKPADYLYMLMFNWLSCVLIALIVGLPLVMDPMVLSVLYVWCQLNQDVVVSFWFGSRFKAMYLPWVLLAFNIVVSGGGAMELIGIIVGHATYFLLLKYPQELGGPAYLAAPAFLKQIFPDSRFIGGFGAAPQARANLNPPPAAQAGRGGGFGGHNWGQGHTLGGN